LKKGGQSYGFSHREEYTESDKLPIAKLAPQSVSPSDRIEIKPAGRTRKIAIIVANGAIRFRNPSSKERKHTTRKTIALEITKEVVIRDSSSQLWSLAQSDPPVECGGCESPQSKGLLAQISS
jgi:hypothetical protein